MFSLLCHPAARINAAHQECYPWPRRPTRQRPRSPTCGRRSTVSTKRCTGAWWNALEFDAAPKIIARLPFVERPDHPAALPVFVISRAAADAMVREIEVWSVRVAGWSATTAHAIGSIAEVVAVPDRAFDGAALLI